VSDAADERISYIALQEGTEVRSADGEPVGKVAHVLADVEDDIFDGIVIEAEGGGHRFADATLVGAISTAAVILTVDAEACRSLPEPSANPAAIEAGPDETVDDGLRDKLRRAWDLISGNY
jgi:hypothetical protein